MSGTGGTARDRELAVALVDIVSDVRRRAHADSGHPALPTGMLEILRVIEDRPGITVAEVADRLGRQVSNVSTQLRELVARGLVTRERAAGDRRVVALDVTADARRIKRELEDIWGSAVGDAAAGLSAEERERMLEALPALQALAARLGEDSVR